MNYIHRIRIRYCDIDKMNIVYHTKHLDYWEWARTELFRGIGYPYFEVEKNGYLLPCKSVDITYHKPASYDEEIEVHCELKYFSPIRVEFSYQTLNLAGDIIVSGNTIHLFTDHKLKLMRLNKTLFSQMKLATHENHPI